MSLEVEPQLPLSHHEAPPLPAAQQRRKGVPRYQHSEPLRATKSLPAPSATLPSSAPRPGKRDLSEEWAKERKLRTPEAEGKSWIFVFGGRDGGIWVFLLRVCPRTPTFCQYRLRRTCPSRAVMGPVTAPAPLTNIAPRWRRLSGGR